MSVYAPVVRENLTTSSLTRCQAADDIRGWWYMYRGEMGLVFLGMLRDHVRACWKCQYRLHLLTELARLAVMPEMEGECQASEPITTSAQL